MKLTRKEQMIAEAYNLARMFAGSNKDISTLDKRVNRLIPELRAANPKFNEELFRKTIFQPFP